MSFKLLTIANNDLPSVKYRYEKLKREEASLKAGNQNSAIIFQELSDQISELRLGTLIIYPVKKKKGKWLSCTKKRRN